MDKKKKKPSKVSAIGIGVFPKLFMAETRFNEHGDWISNIRIPIKEAKDDLIFINEVYREVTGKPHPKMTERSNKEAVYFFEQDEEGDWIKDYVVIKFKAKNIMTKRGLWDRKPKIFDASGTRIKNPLRIGGGSALRVSYEINDYETNAGVKGISLVPSAVQVISLVTWDSTDERTADKWGFDNVDGGFAVEDDYDDDYEDDNNKKTSSKTNNNNNTDEDNSNDEDEDDMF